MQKNIQRAVHSFNPSANSGHLKAHRKAVTYYMQGHGLERSRIHAKRMIEEAANDGNEEAKRWLSREQMRKVGALFRRW